MNKYYVVADSQSSNYPEIQKNSELFKVISKYKTSDSEIYILGFEDQGLEIIKKSVTKQNTCCYIYDSEKYALAVDKNGIKKMSDFKNKYSVNYLRRSIRTSVIKSFWLSKARDFTLKTDRKDKELLKENTIINNPKSLWSASFKSLKFYSIKNDIFCRFRLHIPKNKNDNALILYLHGAGAPGYDNFKQMWEVNKFYRQLKKAKKDCFILAPQISGTGYDAYNTDEHTEALWSLINEIDKIHGKIDFSRIYIIGVSYGGYGTIYECFRHPDRYAAAIPCVPWIYLENEAQVSYFKYGEDKYHLPFNDNGIAELAKTPMWLCCSYIEFKHSNSLYERLKSVGADVRLTRKDKRGHGMWIDFVKDETWIEWLFDKQK